MLTLCQHYAHADACLLCSKLCRHNVPKPTPQVYNYIEKTARVVFGPDLVVLEPLETFNVLSLSGNDR